MVEEKVRAKAEEKKLEVPEVPIGPRDEMVPLEEAMRKMKRTPSLFGLKMQQTWTGLFVFEKLLNENPKIRSIVEIGSGHGALSLYLALWAAFRKGRFITVELVKDKVRTRDMFKMLKGSGLDVRAVGGFDAHNQENIRKLISRGRIGKEPMLVLCDGGDKKLEISLVAPFLRKGDVLMGHDYGKEIDDSAIPDGWQKNAKWHPETEKMRSLLLIMEKKVMVAPLIASRPHSLKITGGTREPWLCKDAIAWLDKKLNKNMRGLEWGCGTSTEWFCARLGFLLSIDHNPEWAVNVLNFMVQFPEYMGKWCLSAIPGSKATDDAFYLGSDKLYHREYAELSWVTGLFDFICVDGRARSACLKTAVRLLNPEGGILVLDNSERPRYDRSCIPRNWALREWNNGKWSTAIWESRDV